MIYNRTMNEVLNYTKHGNPDDLHRQFSQNLPFKHLLIDDFFTADFCQQLLDEFPAFNRKLAKNENGNVGKKAVNEKVVSLGPSYKKLDQLVQSKAFIQYIEKISGVKDLKYDLFYYGGGTHNNLEGQDLDAHVDFTNHPKTGYFRRLNFILYLNKQWQEDWGGSIDLHANPRLEANEDNIVSILPLFNRAVLFETHNSSWHGFTTIHLPEGKKDLSRKSFALYYYTRTRPKKIKTHSTIYVDRHLPENIKVGKILTDEDLKTIKILLARRDQHLKRVYQFNTHMTSKFYGLKYKFLRLFSALRGK
jgi:hypothetical protein